MSFDEDWHVPVDRLKQYVGGATASVERGSIEAHLLACEHCRANLAAARLARGDANDAVLRGIIDRIDQSRRPLRRATGAVQVSLASPALIAASGLLAATLLAVVGLAAAIEPSWAVAALVAVAPLGPVTAAVVAFWPAADPAGSLAAATSLAGGRLPFLRALFATAVSALAGLLSMVFTPLGSSEALVWLLPGFAFAAIVIAAATWTDPLRLAVGLGAGWWTGCALWARGHRTQSIVDAANDLAAHAVAIQVLCIAVILLATIVTLLRRDAQPNWRTA